jgi:asparagine synthase (glutamine-hydrolysing)
LLDKVSKSHFQPFNNPVNLPWLCQLSRVAKANGAEVIATGAAGNFTVSLGGLAFLADFWREGTGAWAQLAWRMSSKPELSWSRILASSFGSMVPAGPYAWFRSMFRGDHLRPDLPLLRGSMRREAEEHRLARFGDPRPKPNMRDHYAMLIRHIEPGDKYSLANWGVDVRDPTADRRLAELCLSLPAKCLVDSRSDRPAYHQAFKDRLPAAVVEGRNSGAQSADWFQTIRPSDVLNGYRRYARNPIVDEIFDLKAITQMIERWPRSASAADLVYDEYCNQLLGGLAVASFINCHFPA